MSEQTNGDIFITPSQDEVRGEFQAIEELNSDAAAGCDGSCQSGTCKTSI